MNEQAEELINDSNNNNVPTSWLSSLPPELQKTESLGKFKDVTTLANSYLELEKSLNARVAVPKNDASDEDWHKFYARLGRPEDKRYTDKRTEEDKPYLSSYEEMFFNSGLSQGEKMLEGLYNFSSDLQKKQEEEIQNFRKSNEAELKSYYSDKGGLDSKIDFIKLALNKYAQPELADYIIEEANYNPALIKFLVNVGNTLKSDSLVTGSEKPTILNKETAIKEIENLLQNPQFMVEYTKGNTTNISRMKQLHEIAYNRHVTTS